MFRLFGGPKKEASIDSSIATANKAEAAAQGLRSAVAVSTAVGLTAVAASGPALPVVAGVGILAAAAMRIYYLNKKLTRLFQRTEKLTRRILPVLNAIEEANKRRGWNLDTKDVRDDASQIQVTIGELIGPQALKEINEAAKSAGQAELGTTGRNSWAGRLKRLGRIIAPASDIANFNEQLIQLSLDFSVLQGEFAIQLESLSPTDAKDTAETKPVDPAANYAIAAAEVGAQNQTSTIDTSPAAVGGRRTLRRRIRRGKTRKNL